MAHLVITIGCEYGAKGNRIGRKVASDLGIKFYDRDTVDEIIKEVGIPKDIMEKVEQGVTIAGGAVKSILAVAKPRFQTGCACGGVRAEGELRRSRKRSHPGVPRPTVSGRRKCIYLQRSAIIMNDFNFSVPQNIIVGRGSLAQIEKGTANPSLGVMGKITSGLRIEFQRLIETPREDFCLVKPEEMVPTKEVEGQHRVWTCFPYEDTRLVEIYRIDVEPGGEYVSGAHGENTREYLTVTDGVLTVECRGHVQRIARQEAYKFETDQMHIYRNEGTERASCFCFFLDYK